MNSSKVKMPKDISYELWLLFTRTRHLVYKARQKELNQYDISARNASVLSVIVRLGGKATPGNLARELFLEPHSVSGLISRMTKQGLINKVKDLERKNLVRIEITEKGYEAYQKSTGRESISDIMSVLTQEEKLELWSLLAKIRGRAIEELEMKNTDVYPVSNPTEL
ncbi:MarR family winged helix-turn-helix transcriptional regulator [Chloroflexota bacterium]